jgi:hypothetical protein
MEAKTTKTIKLTPEEVSLILAEHFGDKDAKVTFRVGGHDRPGDWRAEYPLEYRLDEVCIDIEVSE